MTKHGVGVRAGPVTEHGDQCDGAGINFVECMCYKSVCFYNSLE